MPQSGTSDTYKLAHSCPLFAYLTGGDGVNPPAADLTLGADDYGCEFKVFGATSGNYMLWDESANQLKLSGSSITFVLNALSSAAAGSGTALSASTTQAMAVYADDGNAAIGSGSHIAAGRFRTILFYTGGNREQEASSVRGQLVSKAGVNRHNMCAVLGSYEVNTSLTVDGQIFTTDPWIQAAVMGRIGAGSGITTINTYGLLCGVASMSATASLAANSGVYTAFYAGHWSGSMDWEYALYGEGLAHGAYLTVDHGTVSGEERAVDIVHTGTLSSGDSMVGLNIATTTAGANAAWVSALYAKVTQGSTKNVDGYLCAAELEIVNSAGLASAFFPLVLNITDNSAAPGSGTTAFIALREYGSRAPASFLHLGAEIEAAVGTKSNTALWTTAEHTAATHAIRCNVNNTAFWILCSTTAPSGT